MVLALGMIWIFDGYEVSLISLFRNYIEHESSAEDFKIIATSYQVGCIIGSVGFGICAYLYGRRCVFLVIVCFRYRSLWLSMLLVLAALWLRGRCGYLCWEGFLRGVVLVGSLLLFSRLLMSSCRLRFEVGLILPLMGLGTLEELLLLLLI